MIQVDNVVGPILFLKILIMFGRVQQLLRFWKLQEIVSVCDHWMGRNMYGHRLS
jgi:hypothetical protein